MTKLERPKSFGAGRQPTLPTDHSGDHLDEDTADDEHAADQDYDDDADEDVRPPS
jgi:hypothetical protein